MRTIIVVLLVVLGACSIYAQDKSVPTPTGVSVVPQPPPVPVVPEDVKRQIAEIQAQAVGYQRSIAVLQKEVDGLGAELTRIWQRLQKDGYDLTPQLTYIPKVAMEPVKK